MSDALQKAYRKLVRELYEQDGEARFREITKQTGRSDVEVDAIVESIKSEQALIDLAGKAERD